MSGHINSTTTLTLPVMAVTVRSHWQTETCLSLSCILKRTRLCSFKCLWGKIPTNNPKMYQMSKSGAGWKKYNQRFWTKSKEWCVISFFYNYCLMWLRCLIDGTCCKATCTHVCSYRRIGRTSLSGLVRFHLCLPTSSWRNDASVNMSGWWVALCGVRL